MKITLILCKICFEALRKMVSIFTREEFRILLHHKVNIYFNVSELQNLVSINMG